MSNVDKHLALLGLRATDAVTGFTGVVTSICFDLYGCIQAAINPGLGADGKPMDSHWYDVNRLTVNDPKPVMQLPDFVAGPQSEGKQGAAEKPMPSRC